MLAHVVQRDRPDPAAKHPKGRNGKLTVVLVEPETNTNIAVEMLLGGSCWRVRRTRPRARATTANFAVVSLGYTWHSAEVSGMGCSGLLRNFRLYRYTNCTDRFAAPVLRLPAAGMARLPKLRKVRDAAAREAIQVSRVRLTTSTQMHSCRMLPPHHPIRAASQTVSADSAAFLLRAPVPCHKSSRPAQLFDVSPVTPDSPRPWPSTRRRPGRRTAACSCTATLATATTRSRAPGPGGGSAGRRAVAAGDAGRRRAAASCRWSAEGGRGQLVAGGA